MKYLLIALLVVAVLFWLSRLRARGPGPDRQARRPAQGEPMLQCALCGAHFPESEAVNSASGKVYCSEQHRLRHEPR
ncbi:PP0621 family protein [Noviherbaspirillum aridicola]|uniref:Preprotein translocase subunit YajC n=1 Tax=Noviherbaspirillum aridicola TaxID=2849687 RepID=A0ABQ4Q2A0_9BURK|nr:PP0621 family protein [Noviherbaspirillum aridicola]GIZ50975.1 hypothetical protein NCCP691_09890 [Noviherbaspirillum aridicola]